MKRFLVIILSFLMLSTTSFAATTYTVLFDSLGGSYVPKKTNIPSYSSIKEPPPPTKEGYIFKGWYEQGVPYLFDFSKRVVKSNFTLYAKWQKVKCTLTFNSMGGTTIPTITDIGCGSYIPEPTSPTYSGFKFTGWYTDKDCTKLFDFENTTIENDMTLYSGWEKLAVSDDTLLNASDFQTLVLNIQSSVNVLIVVSILLFSLIAGLNLIPMIFKKFISR